MKHEMTLYAIFVVLQYGNIFLFAAICKLMPMFYLLQAPSIIVFFITGISTAGIFLSSVVTN